MRYTEAAAAALKASGVIFHVCASKTTVRNKAGDPVVYVARKIFLGPARRKTPRALLQKIRKILGDGSDEAVVKRFEIFLAGFTPTDEV